MKQLLLTILAAAVVSGSAIAQDEPKSTAAPETFRVRFETSCGDFTVEVQRKWAPNGADRFHELVKAGFYDECRFFRVVPGFVVQWGMNGDPAVYTKWKDREIKDDKVTESNLKGFITFASRGPDTRTCQLFINLEDNQRLDTLGFAPFGKVVEGMDVVEKINAEYGQSPNQSLIQEQGNEYLKAKFPKLDYIKKATIVPAK
jgi:peptidyl-prolyl cis-trans isomerase A (cyclophilin A)